MRSWQFFSYLKTSCVLWSPKVWYCIHMSCYLSLSWHKWIPSTFVMWRGFMQAWVTSLHWAMQLGLLLPPLLLKTSSDTFLLMTSQCDWNKCSLIIKNQKSALPPYCYRNHFNIILPSTPAWPFFCFIHKLLHYEWTCYTLVNTELDLCTNRRDCKQWWKCKHYTLTVYQISENKIQSHGRVSTKLYLIWPTRCNLYNVLYYYQRSTCFGWFFRPSSGAYKTVCEALGIVMLSHCRGWVGTTTHPHQRESMTIPKAAHTVL